MTTLQAIILAIVEGLTEYLPVSSTGHLIITSSLMGISQESFTKDFTIIVQFGAILSVLFLYWRRFLTSITIYYKLLAAFLPAAIVGLLVKDHIDALLDNVYVVASALIIGGVILLFVDKWFEKQEKRLSANSSGDTEDINFKLTFKQAAGIGMIQCLAFIPGVSRSASSIIGGLSMGLNRKSAAEFSFLLGVPTLTAATGVKLLKIIPTIESEQVSLIILGNVVSFIVGAISIKAFLSFLTRRGFFAFGVYRILVGVIILILLGTGHDLQVM